MGMKVFMDKRKIFFLLVFLLFSKSECRGNASEDITRPSVTEDEQYVPIYIKCHNK